MANQTQKDKAFEYACLNTLNTLLSKEQDVVIEKTSVV